MHIDGEESEVLETETLEVEEAEQPEELVIQIGDEEPEAEDASVGMRALRQRVKELNEENRKLRGPAQAEQQDTLPPRPKQSDPGIDFDEEKFAEKLLEWKDLETQHRAKAGEAEQRAARETERWQAKLTKFEEGKAALKAPDLADAEAVVTEALTQTQMAIVVEGSKDPALVFYALGKNPKKAEEVAKIDNPIEFARAIFELEGQLKVTRRNMPAPEGTVKGGGTGASAVDNTLEKLREDAAKTGDFSKVMAYKRGKRK